MGVRGVGYAQAIAVTFDSLRQAIPMMEDEVIVEVVGQPGASKKDLYYLALAAANGMVRTDIDFVGATPRMGVLMIEYDAADHWVRCTMKYTGGATAFIGWGGGGTGDCVVYAGPQCEVKGKEFNFTSDTLLPGIPSSTNPSIPKLPWDGRVILTPCPTVPNPAPGMGPAPFGPIIPSPNPKPPGDNRSRGAVVRPSPSPEPDSIPVSSIFRGLKTDCCNKSLELVPLVFSALTDPGSFGTEVFIAPTAGPTGS
jgi:hypothetical protein